MRRRICDAGWGLGRRVRRSFWNVQFAEPPVGNLRFASPVYGPRAWEGTRNATFEGQTCCLQFASANASLGRPVNYTEDCLYLNVFTPGTSRAVPEGGFPVVVYYHGGSHQTGCKDLSLFNASRVTATQDVVYVVPNYRLNIFGFIAGDAIRSANGSLNFGLQDQRTALRWVQENARAFGGNPDNVTIQGESAGGHSVIWQILNSDNTGLFHRAIAESPAPWGPPSPQTTAAQYEFVLGQLGLNATAPQEEQLAALKDAPAEMLLEASARLDLYPSVDGTTVKGNELELVARGEYVGNLSGLIIGDNDDEGTVFAAGLGLTNPRAVGAFYESFGPEINATLHELYPIGTTNRSAFAAASNVLGDALFYVPIREFAIAAAGNITDQLFKYRFSGIVSSAQVPGLPLGSFHGVELPYVFNASNFLNASEQLTADNMVHLWTSFASGLLPPSASGNDSVPAWPAYQGPGGEVLQIGPEGGTLRIVPDSQLKHFNESTYNLLVEMLGVGVAGASGSAAQRPAAEDWAIGRLLLAAGNRDGEWKGRKRLWQM